MWLMLQQEHPDDYVIATGETHSVREFLEAAFGFLGLDPYQYLVLDQRFLRPAEVDLLLGDASKARLHLGWSARTGFSELVRDMVSSDLDFYSHSKSKQAGDQNPAAASTVPPADAAQGTLQPTTGN
jgi:GDPmannose 4,6-dehydratase